MKTFGEWKESHFRENPDDKKLGHDALMNKFNAYIKKGLKKSDEPKQEKVNQKNSPSIQPSSTKSIEDKLDKQYKSLETTNEQFSAIEDKLDVLIGLVSHIRFAVVLAVVVWGVLMLAARLQ